MNNIPVIIYHEGNQEYLKICIEHTKRYNDHVILIGNETNREFCDNWYNQGDFVNESRWNEFIKYFVNYSFYSYEFVIQIFKRLFIIEQFVIKNDIEKFVLLDSDILVYINFSKMKYVRQYDVGCVTLMQNYEEMRWITNIGASFFSKDAISEFISFCIEEFKNNKEELILKWKWHQKYKIPGGVGEMPLAYLWLRKTNLKVINMAIPLEDGVGIYENAIASPSVYGNEIFKMNNFFRIKLIIYKEGHPYYINKNGRYQKVDVLHFASDTKRFMKSYSLHNKVLFQDYIDEALRKLHRKFHNNKVQRD